MRTWCLCLSLVASLSIALAAQQTAAISRTSLLRDSPTNANAPLGRLAPGDTVTLLSTAKRQGYYHVQTADGKAGWVWAKNVNTTAAPPAPPPPPPPPPPPRPPSTARGRASSGTSAPTLGTEAIDTPSCQPTGTQKTTGHPLAATDKEGLLNVAKRHIPSGTPKTLTLTDFVTLEQAAEAAFGINAHTQDFSIAPSRDKLKSLPGTAAGEGEAIQLAGYINFAKTEQPESVNCYDPGHLDIHINVGPKGGSQMQGVVVEMIPQLARPAGWDELTLNVLKTQKLQVLVVGSLTLDTQHRLRNTANKKDTQPQRVALWEVHPIIEFYVCETGTCDPAHHDQWTPLQAWKTTHP
jgi:hypothetical protein